jgi:integrase
MTGHVRRRGKRSWAIVLDIGEDAAGKRLQKWHSIKGTKRQADEELARLLTDLNTGAYVPPKKTTVAEFLERWLTDYAASNTSAKTFERYTGVVRQHLVKAFGSKALVALHPTDIQSYYTRALVEGRADGKEGGLSAQSVLHHHRILHRALQSAVKWRLLVRNPADSVDPPKPPRREVKAFDGDRSAELIDSAIGTRVYMPILLATCTGMRRGEILAFRWADCDMRRAVITVNRSVEETKAGITFKSPKNRRGREIEIPAILVDALRDHRRQQETNRVMYGADYETAADLVCCLPDGSLWKPSAFTSAYRDLLRRRKLPAINFHRLRHSHASQLLRDGVNPKVISERLGHSKVAFTLDVYSHLLPGMQGQAAKSINATLQKALQKRRKKSSAA